MMYRFKVMLAALAVVLGSAGLATVTTAHTAYAQGSNIAICYQGQCQNKWNNGALIKFYGYNNGGIVNNGWGLHLAGTVSNGTGGVIWPFTNGSGLNNRYNGLKVIQYGFNSQGGNFANGCMTSDGFNPSTETGQLETTACVQNDNGHLIPDQQLFVTSSGGFIIPVYASNITYTFYHTYNLPVFEGASGGNIADDQPVIMTVAAGQLGPWIGMSNLP